MSSTQSGLFSLVYVSTARDEQDADTLADLLQQSRAANARRALTGMLLYRLGRFIQVLEGPEDEVLRLVSSIRADPRHTDMNVLLEEHIDARRFAQWSMGYEPVSGVDEPSARGFRSTFDDLETGPQASALRAIRELTLWFRVRSAGAAPVVPAAHAAPAEHAAPAIPAAVSTAEVTPARDPSSPAP